MTPRFQFDECFRVDCESAVTRPKQTRNNYSFNMSIRQIFSKYNGKNQTPTQLVCPISYSALNLRPKNTVKSYYLENLITHQVIYQIVSQPETGIKQFPPCFYFFHKQSLVHQSKILKCYNKQKTIT